MQAEYREHSAVLLRAARRLGLSATEAEELTQSVWTTFLEVAPRFEGRSRVRTFLLGVLRREAAAARRRGARVTLMEPAALNELDSGITTEPSDAHEVRRVIGDCVATLNAREREAVELKLIAERETREVSGLLGISANYLGVLLHRARAHLRHCVEAHFA